VRAGTARVKGGRMADASIQSERTHVFPLELGRAMPVIARGDGVWIEDAVGRRYLDAMSGGSMAATLGHGRRDIIEAARVQAEKLAYAQNERLTNPLQ
jgi:adenosylmethionine-8-amino-7-oxononanoate aminotransferase